MSRFFLPPKLVHDASISCLICHKFRCGFHALPRIALTLVEPVFGTSTKMHLCLCEITALPDRSVGVFESWVGRDSNPEPTPEKGAALPIELPTHARNFSKVHSC